MTAPAGTRSAAWTGARTRLVQLRGGPVQLREVGAGPPLVLLHGWGMGAAAFAALDPLAGDGFHLLAPDLPGFAGTPAWTGTGEGTGEGTGARTLAGCAALLVDLCDTLALEHPVLVGWSMGASIAWTAAAAAAPGRFAGIVSLDMSPRIASEPGWPLALAGGHGAGDGARAAAAMTAGWPQTCAAFVPRILAPEAPDRARLEAGLLDLAAHADPVTAASLWTDLVAADLRAAFAALPLPLLAIHGGRSALYDARAASVLARLNPRCRVETVPEAGHAPHLEAPQQVARLIHDFATRRPAVLAARSHS